MDIEIIDMAVGQLTYGANGRYCLVEFPSAGASMWSRYFQSADQRHHTYHCSP